MNKRKKTKRIERRPSEVGFARPGNGGIGIVRIPVGTRTRRAKSNMLGKYFRTLPY